jgi:hypothetical protein
VSGWLGVVKTPSHLLFARLSLRGKSGFIPAPGNFLAEDEYFV